MPKSFLSIPTDLNLALLYSVCCSFYFSGVKKIGIFQLGHYILAVSVVRVMRLRTVVIDIKVVFCVPTVG